MQIRSQSLRSGFTLVELVVVVLVLGIIASVAAPRMFDTASTARDNALKQTLQVVRDAIELYRVQNGGAFPGRSSNLPEDLSPYLRGRFPTCPVENRNAMVSYTTGPQIKSDATAKASWKYSTDFGTFICNSSSPTATDPTVSYDQL